MSIRDDKQFNTLMHRYAQRYFYDDAHEHRKELFDYIDNYAEKQYEEGIESEKDRCS